MVDGPRRPRNNISGSRIGEGRSSTDQPPYDDLVFEEVEDLIDLVITVVSVHVGPIGGATAG